MREEGPYRERAPVTHSLNYNTARGSYISSSIVSYMEQITLISDSL
jgi:hypothetical protein